jgi:hypothetical protein
VRDDRVRLGDILEAIERIEKYAGQRRDALLTPNSVPLTPKTFGRWLAVFAT